jgi:hypothetical protein
MSQAAYSETAPIPSSVAAKLRALRAQITSWLTIDGLSRVLLVLVILIAVDFVADWWFNFDVQQRIVMLVLAGAALAWVAYRRLLLPLSTGVSDDALVLTVEKHYGRELGESLISAVQFSRLGDLSHQGVSPQLVKATIDQGTQAAGRIPFGSIVNSRWLMGNVAILAVCGALLAVGLWAAFNTKLGEIWFNRNVLLGDKVWPQDANLEVQYAQGDKLLIPRGDDWLLSVTVKEDSKQAPDKVMLDVYAPSGRRTEEMTAVPQRPIVIVKKDNARKIDTLDDLLAKDLKVVAASPDQSVLGRAVRRQLMARKSGDSNRWRQLEGHISQQNGFTSNLEEVIAAVGSGKAVAGIVWEELAKSPAHSDAFRVIHLPELEADQVEGKRYELKLTNVLEEARFRARAVGIRGQTGWRNIKLVDRPWVENLTLTTVSPKYAVADVNVDSMTDLKSDKKVPIFAVIDTLLVKEGQMLKIGAPLLAVKPDGRKILSPLGGLVEQVHVKPGDKIFLKDPSGTPDAKEDALLTTESLATIAQVQAELPPGTGPYQVLAGSTMHIQGTANKELSKATLLIGGAPHELTIAEDKKFSLSLAGKGLGTGSYEIKLVDREKVWQQDPPHKEPGPLESKRPTRFTLRVNPDTTPKVIGTLVGISSIVVPQALIPFDVQVRDDYKVTDVQLHYEWKHDDEGGGHGEGTITPPNAKDALGRKTVKFGDALDLEPLGVAIGSGLSLRLIAKDNNDVSGPATGESPIIPLRVVSEDELRADLMRRQKEQGGDFQRLLKNQQNTLTDCEALQAEIRDLPAMSAEQRQKALTFQKGQKVMGAGIANIAKRLTGILIEFKNNRLKDELGQFDTILAERIITPMNQLVDFDVPETVRHLDECRQKSGNAEARNAALQLAIVSQQKTVASMEEILRHLGKLESYQEAITILVEIQKLQEQVRDLTEKEKQKIVADILGDSPTINPEKFKTDLAATYQNFEQLLDSIKDGATADAALLELKKVSATADVLGVVWTKLPEVTKTQATAITTANQAKLKEKITLVLAIPGVAEKIQPVLTEITDKMGKFTN